ncbi:MAG: tRNA (adenosine(37)-N6)-dimethylallyltransferase MiaA [Sporolactobacillus sp.]
MDGKVIAIVGPTAVGKSRMGVFLARALGGEVINGDASQIYRGMAIGTAKITSEEAEGVPHHLLDLREPDQAYTAADYQKDARQILRQLIDEKKIPILIGGTGFYLKAALYDYQFSAIEANPQFRKQLEKLVCDHGHAILYERLKQVDPVAAERIHPHNQVRIIRALEVCHETGRPFSEQQRRVPERSLYNAIVIGLTMDRSLLYQRIDRRVEQMMARGLLEEVRGLYDRGLAGSQALQAIGYKEFFPYFEGRESLEEAVSQLKKNSRHYAKRQFTWFRGQMAVHWVDMGSGEEDFASKAEAVLRYVREHLVESAENK